MSMHEAFPKIGRFLGMGNGELRMGKSFASLATRGGFLALFKNEMDPSDREHLIFVKIFDLALTSELNQIEMHPIAVAFT